MKKLGLRAVAGSLAVLMVASVFAPAKAANAADMLITAKAPKTLVLTADMVDDDGEIVISNEDWDRIIVENGVDAKNIYFDGVEVKELVVESGSKTKVQLWDVDAAQVTVQEPEFDEVSLKDILPLLADKETQQAALNMYLENKQAVAAAAKRVPTISTMEGAKVDALVARANANLDLAEGDVAVVALEASDKLDRATVTLKNFDGDVTYKGNDKFNSMTLKNVNSTVSLTVDESTDKNYFTVTGKNSLVEKAEVAGNAKVALDAPMGVVEISEKATAAQVTILDEAEELNVASKGAKVELTMNADVAVANVTADNVKVEGKGTLKEANLEGKGAYVSTNGTKVEGENTYVKPVYVEKPEDIELTFATLGAGGWGNTRLGSEDGGEKYTLNANYGGEVIYALPKSVDACLYSEAVIRVKTEDGKPVTVKLTHEGADKDSWGNPVPFFSKSVTGEATITVPLALHAGKMIDQVRFQSAGDAVTAVFYDVTFKLNPNGPVEPIVPPADGTLCNGDAWKLVAFNTDFRQFAGKNVKITVEAIRLGGPVDLKANGQFEPEYGTGIHWGKEITTEWTDFGTESWTVPAAWADKTAPIYYAIRNVDGQDYAQSLIYYRNFSVEVLDGGETEDPTTTPEPEDPTTTPKPEVDLTGATKCDTNKWQVHHFYDYNLVDYVGKEVSFSVDMVRVKGDASAVIMAQDSQYSTMYEVAEIGEEWKTFTYTLTVPADYAEKENAYVGFRWKDANDNFADYEFYFKNFKFSVKGEETEEPEVTPDPTPEVTPDPTPEPSAQPNVVLTPTDANAVTLTVNEDGSVQVDCTGNYKGVTYAVPETATKVNEVSTVILNITAASQFGLQAYDTTGTKFVDQYPGYSLSEMTTADYYVTIDPSKNVLSSLLVQCLDKAETTTFTINSITFVAEQSVVIDEFELGVGDDEASVVTVTKNDDGSSTIECAAQYKGASYTIPADVIGDGKIVSISVDVNIDNQICLQAYDSSWNMLTQDYPGYGITEATDKTFTLAVHPSAEAGIGALRIQSQKADQSITVKSITVNKALWVETNW